MRLVIPAYPYPIGAVTSALKLTLPPYFALHYLFRPERLGAPLSVAAFLGSFFCLGAALPLFLGLPNVMKRKGSGACLACHSSSKQLYWRRYSSGREADVCVGPSDATLQMYGLETIGKGHHKSAPLDKE